MQKRRSSWFLQDLGWRYLECLECHPIVCKGNKFDTVSEGYPQHERKGLQGCQLQGNKHITDVLFYFIFLPLSFKPLPLSEKITFQDVSRREGFWSSFTRSCTLGNMLSFRLQLYKLRQLYLHTINTFPYKSFNWNANLECYIIM